MSSNHDEQRTGLNWYRLKKLRFTILSQQNFLCARCTKDIIKNRLDIELHHIDGNPRNNRRSNLEVLCSDCHDQEHPDVNFRKNGFSNKSLTSNQCPICAKTLTPERVNHNLCSSCYYTHFGRNVAI